MFQKIWRMSHTQLRTVETVLYSNNYRVILLELTRFFNKFIHQAVLRKKNLISMNNVYVPIMTSKQCHKLQKKRRNSQFWAIITIGIGKCNIYVCIHWNTFDRFIVFFKAVCLCGFLFWTVLNKKHLWFALNIERE